MIRLHRDSTPPAIAIYGPEPKPTTTRRKKSYTTAAAETRAAIAHFGTQPSPTNDGWTDFKIYKDKLLLEKLKEVCLGKCVYCESRFVHISPADVEHYRPKSAVNLFTNRQDCPDEPLGYYWLAADWNNLLLSCNRCNRGTYQAVAEYPNPTILVKKVGKGTRFPVLKIHVKRHDEVLDGECPLLLNPFSETTDPERYMKFHSDGTIQAITPASDDEPPYGLYTIEVCGLHRKDLSDERRISAQGLLDCLQQLKRHFREAILQKSTTGTISQYTRNNITVERNRLRAMFGRHTPYLGMKRYLLRDALANDPGVKQINDGGLKLDDLLTLN